MKKCLLFLAIASISLACSKIEKPVESGQIPVDGSTVDLMVSVPSMTKTTTTVEGGVSKTVWNAGDEITVSMGGDSYIYVAQNDGATVRFSPQGESIPAASAYTLTAAYGGVDDVVASQSIVEGKNTTKQPISASCTDQALVDGLLPLVFDQEGSLLQFNFADEDLTIKTLKLTSLDGTPLIGTSAEITVSPINAGSGISLSGGETNIQIVLNKLGSKTYPKGVLLVANEGEADAVARLIWLGKTVDFGSTNGQHLVQPLSAWVIGGINSASDLVCYSYCSNNGISTRRFTSDPEDPEMEASVTNQVKLLANIDMTGIEWTPINVFHGIFDGNGKTIDNLIYSYSGEGVEGSGSYYEVGGIFNEFGGNGKDQGRSSILKNLTIGSGCNFTLDHNKTGGVQCVVGGIAARVGFGSIIKNVTNKAYVLMKSTESSSKYIYAGGVVGLFQGSKIADVTVEGKTQFRIDGSSGSAWMSEVAASPLCGSIRGQSAYVVSDCEIKNTAEFIGHVRTYVNYCVETQNWCTGTFGRSGFGGIVGITGQEKHTAATAVIRGCSNAAPVSVGWWSEKNDAITTPRNTGCEIDYNRNMVSNIGGIVGMIGHKSNQTGVTVQNCSNTGTVILSGFQQVGNNHVRSTGGGIVGLAVSSGSVFKNLSNSAEIIIHGQQVGCIGGVIGALIPNSTDGSNFFTGKTSTAEYLENHGEVYISGNKTYFKHGNVEAINCGGIAGYACGQIMTSGTPEHQHFAHCYNDADVGNCCSGGDTNTNPNTNPNTNCSFDVGGCFGRVAVCTFNDVQNFGNVYNTKEHGGELGGFAGAASSQGATTKGGAAADFICQFKFTDCGQYGNVLNKKVDLNNADMGMWFGWNSRASSYFAPDCSNNKISGTFGVYGDTSNQTTVTSSNFASVLVQTDVAHDKKTKIRIIEGANGPLPAGTFNSFGYGAKPGAPVYTPATASYLSFNIRLNSSSDSGVRAWDYRKAGVAAMLNSVKPDIFGLQEVKSDQYTYIASQVGSTYSVVKGSNDVDDSWVAQNMQGEADVEFKPIFYKNTKFSVLNSGTFWLSRTPNTKYSDSWYWASGDTDTSADPTASTGTSFKNDKPRIAVWAIFQENTSGRQFFVLNTHFPKKSHSNDADDNNHCWSKCSSLIAAKIVELSQGLPVIVGGDFNIEDTNKRLTPITNICYPARTTAPVTDYVKSFHNWQRSEEWQGNLDGIYYRGITTSQFKTISAAYAGVSCISDHYPVLAEFYL